MTAKLLLLILSIVLFLLAGLGVHVGSVSEFELAFFGLAAFAASFLPV